MKRFSFLRARPAMIGVSIALMALAVISMTANGGRFGAPLNLGIEFTGGMVFDLDLGQEPDVQAVKDAVAPLLSRSPSAQVVTEGGQSVVSLRTEEVDDPDALMAAIAQAVPGFDPSEDLLFRDEIGGQFSRELGRRAALATIVGTILVLLYIAFRFNFSFGLGAVVALSHDLLVVIGIFAAFGVEVGIPFVAAILTILGYSINDTIVVYDRIRERLRESDEDEPFEQVVEGSLWQTLSRTMNTTATTLLALLAIHFLGGATLRPFTLALIIGFVSGTYSSLFVAAPFVIWWERRFGGGGDAPEPVPAAVGPAPAPEAVTVAPAPESKPSSTRGRRRRGRPSRGRHRR